VIESSSPACPLPLQGHATVQMAHGGGGRVMQQLIRNAILPAFDNALLNQQHDGAAIEVDGTRLAFTTDSFVVQPLFFPGGDIGTLAVNGTVNDLAMCGARPRWLSAAFILEEGFEMDDLWRIIGSMKASAIEAGVEFVTGDTKVVDRGKGDGLFINTAGIGTVEAKSAVHPQQVQPGDAVVLSGDIGRHGIAIMTKREGLEFETEVRSDCAPLVAPVLDLISSGIDVHCMRDLTRGGLTSGLVEIAEASDRHIAIDELTIPVTEQVRGACEVLGLDPMCVANEGRFVVFVPDGDAVRAVDQLRGHAACPGACIIGRVESEDRGWVTLKSAIGATRILDMLSGEQLPRIC